MALVTGSWNIDIILITATVLYLVYWYYTTSVSYFKSRGIPYLSPFNFMWSMGMSKKAPIHYTRDLYNCFPGERFFGLFLARVPALVVKDPDLVQRIMVKDFAHFTDRGFKGIVIEGDMLSKNLFFLKGQTWRSLRSKLIPTFTSGKLKFIFNQFSKIGDHLLEEIDKKSADESIDAKLVSMNFATEVIGCTAFGIDFSKNNPQTVEFKSRITTAFLTGFRQKIFNLLVMIAPKVPKLLGWSFFVPGAAEYFLNLIKSNKEYRKRNNIMRNDYFQELMTLQEAEESGKTVISLSSDNNEEVALINQMEYAPQSTFNTETKLLTDEGITAQAVGFLMAGTDSVSMILSFALYHIAKDSTIQDKLGQEVNKTLKKHGSWTYQAVRELTYLDQILQETLRFYITLPLNFRECTTPYKIPNSEIILEKGSIVIIPVTGLQMDPDFYPDPDVFSPDRFENNNYKPNVKYMPFGDGPRICIGMRFAIVEMKVCLAKIFSKYIVKVNKKTQLPLVFDPNSFNPSPVGGIWIDFKKQEN